MKMSKEQDLVSCWQNFAAFASTVPEHVIFRPRGPHDAQPKNWQHSIIVAARYLILIAIPDLLRVSARFAQAYDLDTGTRHRETGA
jgi:hypothetical protein